MTEKLYLLADPPLRIEARITALGTPEDPFVRLERTIAHAQGGGQQSDRGRIAGRPLLRVRHDGNGGIEHVLGSIEGLAVGMDAAIEIDAEFRAVQAAYHTFGHLLAGAAEKVSSGRLVAEQGHQWPSEARVEFRSEDGLDAAALEPDIVAQTEADMNAGLGVEILDLDGVRAIRIGGYAPIPCGGTHLASLKSLPPMFALKARTKKGRVKINYALSSAAPHERHGFAGYDPAKRGHRWQD